MKSKPILIFTPMLLAAQAVDRLPLKRGIFVDSETPCRDAPNISIMSYWGGNNALNISKSACTIKKIIRKGNSFVVDRRCDSQGYVENDTIRLTIPSSTKFIIDGTSYRWCANAVSDLW